MSSRNPEQMPTNGHSSRRDHLSVSSTTSSASGRTERGSNSRQPSNPAVESAVTRLLVSIKALLESLTQWSQQRVDENHVSNVYVRLGNDFNAAVAAFAAFNIDMAELLSVPEDLRTVLEQCLAEDATTENLELFLPSVRQIITNLLQGLRTKQSIYRRIMSDHRQRSGEPGHERTGSRSERAERTSRRDGSHRAQISRTVTEEERQEVECAVSRRSAPSSGRSRREVNSQVAVVSNADEPFVNGFAPTIEERTSQPAPEPNQLVMSRAKNRSPPSVPSDQYHSAVSTSTSSIPQGEPAVQGPASPSLVPASMKRYSLVDKPASAVQPSVQIEPSSPDISQTNVPTSPSSNNITLNPPPAVANSLAALKKNDVLERRASKRFSIYNISKMTNTSTTRERSLRGQGHPHRRSLATTAAPTANELAVLTEVDDEEIEPFMQQPSRPITPEAKLDPSSISGRPITPARTAELTSSSNTADGETVTPSESPTHSRITVFLQLGREVKKVTIEQGLSFSSLRVLFVDKFSYNPGQDNFPAIYIRDPASGVQYELEDVDEVKDKCLLSLNIEALDQIKQHIDAQISTLSQDIKDLKTAVSNTQRHSLHIPDITTQPLAESTPALNRPTDRQFQHVARRLSRFVGDSSLASMITQSYSPPPSNGSILPQMTGQSLQPQMTGASILSDYSNRVVGDLKTQFDEVQNLRRDLGIMRQMYTEFMKQTKETLGTLRTQTQSVKQLASTNVGGARGYIDSGKKKLDVRSQDVLTEVEKLQDTVERVKDDVIKRNTTPKPLFFKNLKKDIDSTAIELESLKEHIKTIKPMWKKTWEEELQNIVEEQQFLSHQEEFLSDLIEDHKAVLEIYGHVEKVINLRGPQVNGQARLRTRAYRPPLPDEGSSGLTDVMLEIRGASVDPEKRLKAIEASQKTREMERANRQDDLQVELQDFVGQKKLKMTGGAEETERLRQRKNEMTLKAMFNPSGGASHASDVSSASSSSYHLPPSPP